jgi:hypothetical protein
MIASKNRYYVQHLTEQIFLVRACRRPDAVRGSDDPIVRSFLVGHDAFQYAERLNECQREPHKLSDHGEPYTNSETSKFIS